jgi:hypothetical protein
MRVLAEDLAAARKFMLQTAQLGWVRKRFKRTRTASGG